MTEAVQHKVSLGVFAGLIGVILALFVGFAPSPAQAQDSIEQGGLVFTFENNSGPTKTTVSAPNEHGVITIQGGNADMTVTQKEVGSGGVAGSLVIGGTNNYTGTITLDNVQLAAVAGEDQSTLTFANTTALPTSGSNRAAGCTVILTNGSTLMGETTEGSNPSPIVSFASLTNDTLELADGASIQPNPKTATGDIADVAVSAISVTGPDSGDAGNFTLLFSGDASILGGNDTDAAIVYTGTATGDSSGTFTITSNSNASITGVSGEDPADALNAALGNKPVGNNEIPLTINGTGSLEIVGGTNTGNTAAGGAIGMSVESTSNAATTVQVNPGSSDNSLNLDIQGGNGADIESGAATDSVGGAALSITGVTVTDTKNNEVFSIFGGDVTITGGNGGSTSGDSAGPGGNAVIIDGAGTAAAGGAGILDIEGGNVTITGGNAGSGTPTSTGGNGIAGSGANGNNANCYLYMQNGTGTAMTGPTVTVQGGKNNAANPAMNIAITNIGANGANIMIAEGTVNKGVPGKATYPWAAMTCPQVPDEDVPATMVGFAGIPQAPATVTSNVTGTYNTITQKVLTAADPTGINVAPNWVQIKPAPITSLTAGVGQYNNGTVPATTVDYVVAQTEDSMTDTLPDPAFQYTATVTPVFEGIGNANVSNFVTLLGGASAGGVTTNDFTVTPADMVTVKPKSGNNLQNFWVNPDAQGETVTVDLGEGSGVTALEDFYPNLTLSPMELPVVYTITINSTAQANGGYPTSNSAITYYTAPDGSGTLTTLAGAIAYNTPVANFKKLQSGDVLVNTSQFTINAGNYFIGLYDENVDPMKIVSNGSINGWSSNAELTAEFGAVSLLNITPTPQQMQQGATATINANYTVNPVNKKLTYYNIGETGINLGWAGVFVGRGQGPNNQGNFGSAQSNGVYVDPTDCADATGSAPWTVTATATVSASTLANLGHYRFAPCSASPWGIGNTTALTSASSKYGIVEIVAGEGTTPVLRIYNPNTGEHIYTDSQNEYNYLDNIGWDPEGVAWIQPTTSNVPIYRLYNPNNGDHMYTTSLTEYNGLQKSGWRGEGAKLYSAPNTEAPIYRLYNSHITANGGAYAHLWTGDFNEYTVLGNATNGWTREGTAWYALSLDAPAS